MNVKRPAQKRKKKEGERNRKQKEKLRGGEPHPVSKKPKTTEGGKKDSLPALVGGGNAPKWTERNIGGEAGA